MFDTIRIIKNKSKLRIDLFQTLKILDFLFITMEITIHN